MVRRQHLDSADISMDKKLSVAIASLQSCALDKNPEEIKMELETILKKYGPGCEERLAVWDYQFRQLGNMVLPPYVQLLLWISVQDDAFFTISEGNSAVADDR